MQFKSVNDKYYYIDNKRVNKLFFNNMELLCNIKGMRYNSSILYYDNNKKYNCFCYD